ncbi:MAG: hypothetical protein ACP5GX_12100 [Anaerolineae bacterium]
MIVAAISLFVTIPAVIGVSLARKTPIINLIKSPACWLIGFLCIAITFLLVFGAFLIVGDFVRTLYALESVGDGAKVLTRAILGLFTFKPYIVVRDGGKTIIPDNARYPLKRVGGVGNLILYNDTAVITEQRGLLKRVLVKPAYVKLEAFERMYAAVDLRPRHWVYTVGALSKEGIPIKCKVDVSFQIDDRETVATAGQVHPADPKAVLKAGTATWVREEERFEDKMDWTGRVIISNTEGTLRGMLAQTSLDEIIPIKRTPRDRETQEVISGDSVTGLGESQISEDKDAREVTRRRLERDLRERLERSCESLGVKILNVHVGHLEVEEEISQQWLDLWRATWRKWATQQIGKAKAQRIQIVEDARRDAQIALVNRIAEIVKQIGGETDRFASSTLALRFISAMRETEDATEWLKIHLPSQSLETFEKLRKIVLQDKPTTALDTGNALSQDIERTQHNQ